MILIDFDRTIFDSDRFYEFIRLSLPDPVSVDHWQNIYREYQQEHSVMNIFSMLRQRGYVNDADMATLQHEIARQAPYYVYDDAKSLLNDLTARHISYAIFSFGEEEFQMYKIMSSKIPLHKVVITQKPKHLHAIMEHAQVWIDDNPREFSRGSSDNTSRILLSRIDGKYSKDLHTTDNWSTIESLDELTVDKDGDVRIVR